MMATPLDLDVFGPGFALSEGIVESASDIFDLETSCLADSAKVQLVISQQAFTAFKGKRRALAGHFAAAFSESRVLSCSISSRRASNTQALRRKARHERTEDMGLAPLEKLLHGLVLLLRHDAGRDCQRVRQGQRRKFKRRHQIEILRQMPEGGRNKQRSTEQLKMRILDQQNGVGLDDDLSI